MVQELILGLKFEGPSATRVLFDSYQFSWSELAVCCRWLDSNLTSVSETIKPKERASDLVEIKQGIGRVLWLHEMALKPSQGREDDISWARWLIATLPVVRDKASSDPRDKIFALYGLRGLETRVAPDYTQSTSTVYRQFAADMIHTTSSLDVLHERETRAMCSESGIDLPSWVPDWTILLERTSLRPQLDISILRICPWHGIGAEYAIIGETEDGNLSLLGKHLEHIVFVSNPIKASDMGLLVSKNCWLFDYWDAFVTTQ